MNHDVYISSKEIIDTYHVSYTTLRRWEEEGKVSCCRTPGGFRRYKAKDIAVLFGAKEPNDIFNSQPPSKFTVCYARVSSEHQRADLERQVSELQSLNPESLSIRDIGSGINWNRPGFKRLLDLVHEGKVAKLVLTHRDRLCRFAYDLLAGILEKAGVEILVLSKGEDSHNPDPERELADDLLAITNHFVAKNNGLRAAANRKKKKRA